MSGEFDSDHPSDAELFDYADGSLRADERELVATHLSGCEDCSRLHSLAQRSQTAIKQIPLVAMPEPAVNVMDIALEADWIRRTQRLAGNKKSRQWFQRGAALAFAVTIASILGVAASQFGGTSTNAPNNTAKPGDSGAATQAAAPESNVVKEKADSDSLGVGVVSDKPIAGADEAVAVPDTLPSAGRDLSTNTSTEGTVAGLSCSYSIQSPTIDQTSSAYLVNSIPIVTVVCD